MINENGLDVDVADRIGEYVQLNGDIEIVDKLMNDERLTQSTSALNGLKSLKLLWDYCELYGLTNEIKIDLSLARGLDYYTGVIFEAALEDTTIKHIGSVAGGGRYDNLVEMFHPSALRVPCVGISIGVERIFALIEAKLAKSNTKLRTTHTDVYVASAHGGLIRPRMEIIAKLWNAGIRAEHSYRVNPKLLIQLQYCEKNAVPYAIILGESELDRGEVIWRDIPTRTETLIRIDDLIDEIQRRLKAQ